MRLTTFLFIAFQVLDFITTGLGMKMGMVELNPIQNKWGWGTFIIFKILTIILIALVLEFKKPSRLDILVPAILAFFILLNAIQLVLAW